MMYEFLSFFVDSEGYGYLITPAQENFLGTSNISLLTAPSYQGKQENNDLTIEVEYTAPNYNNYYTLDPNYLPDNGAGVGYAYYGISNYEANPEFNESLLLEDWEDPEGALWHSVAIELNETLVSGQEVYFDFGYNIVFTMLPEGDSSFLSDRNDDYQIDISYGSGEIFGFESDHFFVILDIKDTSSIFSYDRNHWTLSFEGEKTHKIDKKFIPEEYCTYSQAQKMIDEAISNLQDGNEVSW